MMTPEQAQQEAERRYPEEGEMTAKILSRVRRNDFTVGVQWAQEHTKKEAIRFAQWCGEHYILDVHDTKEIPDKSANYTFQWFDNDGEMYTTEQLYELFKNTP